MHNLACSAYDRKDYAQAATEFKAVLELQKEVMGPTHPYTMRNRRNLAVALRRCGDPGQANKLDNETLEIVNSLDENKETERLQTLENLAKGLRDQKRYEEAESIHRQELELRLASGIDDKGLQDNLNDIAFVLAQQGKHVEAETIYYQILSYRTVHYGPEHEETLRTLWNLALTYRERRNFSNAEAKYLQLAGTQLKTHGIDHPKTLDSLEQLAWVLQQQEKYAQAEDRYRFLLDARTKSLGSEHPATLLIMNNLASVLKYQDRASEEATTLLRHVYEIGSRVSGPDSDLAKKSMWALPHHLGDSGHCEDAGIARRKKMEPDQIADLNNGTAKP